MYSTNCRFETKCILPKGKIYFFFKSVYEANYRSPSLNRQLSGVEAFRQIEDTRKFNNDTLRKGRDIRRDTPSYKNNPSGNKKSSTPTIRDNLCMNLIIDLKKKMGMKLIVDSDKGKNEYLYKCK